MSIPFPPSPSLIYLNSIHWVGSLFNLSPYESNEHDMHLFQILWEKYVLLPGVNNNEVHIG